MRLTQVNHDACVANVAEVTRALYELACACSLAGRKTKKKGLTLSEDLRELDEEFARLFNPAIPKEELKFDKLNSFMAVLPAGPTVNINSPVAGIEEAGG